VDQLLHNVCPNCGGGFAPRPIRPAQDWKGGNHLGHDPASSRVVFRPVDVLQHQRWCAELQHIPPQQR